MTTKTSRYIPKALLRPRSKPLLIWAAPPFLIISALASIAFSTLVAVNDSGVSPSIAGEPVSRAAYLGFVYPLDMISAAISVIAAFGLIAEWPAARPLLTRGVAVLLLAYVIVTSAVAGLAPFVIVLEMWFSWLILGFAFWYFYENEHVRSYYAGLERRRGNADA
jgi:hypothetical protein